MEEMEKKKELAGAIADLPEYLQDVAAAYIMGMVDARRITEAVEKKEPEEKEQDPA